MNKKLYPLICFLLIGVNCFRPSADEVKHPEIVYFVPCQILQTAGATKKFYDTFGQHTFWNSFQNREELLDFLTNDIEKHGFKRSDFLYDKLIGHHQKYQQYIPSQRVAADFDFTTIFLKATFYLNHGRVHPKKIISDWEIDKKRTIDYQLPFDALKNHSVKEALLSQIPKNKFYQELQSQWEQSKNPLDKLLLNMERARWIPDDLGEYYVWVNIPEMKLRWIEKGEVLYTHRTIIGKTDRKTPVLNSAFNSIVLNPTWTVPPTILKNDVLPAATNNRSYFANRRIKILDSKGNEVEPEDWNPERYKSYRYVQEPGKSNALGTIKFNFPNNHMVYLHDTNNRSLFANDNRTLSSGCVRVEHSFDLATYIFNTENKKISKDNMIEIVESEKTKHISLSKKVKIYQTYFTTIVENNQLKSISDPYQWDEAMIKRIKAKK